jgi:hypothetical protein
MRSRTSWLAVALFGVGLFALGACSSSTDDQCTEACQVWESLCAYSDYTFEDCFAECKADGDWSGLYVSCLQAATDCDDVEACNVL